MKHGQYSHKRSHPVLAPDDYKRRRRQRRMERTMLSEGAVRAWAGQHGLTLRVLNGGHHWILEKLGMFAEWWPSSAKLVLNRDYLHDRHAPHWSDVAAALEHSGSDTNTERRDCISLLTRRQN